MTPIVAAVDATKTYRRGSETVVAVRNVTLTINAGQLTLINGPSGSGKTTLLNLLTGFELPDTGQIRWLAGPGPVTQLTWESIAVVPQRHGLLAELTVAENVRFPLLVAGTRGPVDTTLGLFGLASLGDRRPDELSLGEQQRAALARAAASSPRLFVCDEPTSSQNEAWGHQIASWLALSARTNDQAVVVASHDPIMLEHADRVLDLLDGSVVEDRTDTTDPRQGSVL